MTIYNFVGRIFVTVLLVEIFNFIGYANTQPLTSHCIMMFLRLLISQYIARVCAVISIQGGQCLRNIVYQLRITVTYL